MGMKKARLIGHLQELDGIRRDEYMPQEVVNEVIKLEKVLTKYLLEELEHPSPDGARKTKRDAPAFSAHGGSYKTEFDGNGL